MASDVCSLSSDGEAHHIAVTVRCDILKAPLLSSFEARGWRVVEAPTDEDDDDDFAWRPGASTLREAALRGTFRSSGLAARTEPLDSGWVLWWASVQAVRAAVLAPGGLRLLAHQRLNHFPNHWELTRKDRMYFHIVQYAKRGARRNAGPFTAKSGPKPSLPAADVNDRGESIRDFVPATFALPNDYAMLVDAAKRAAGATWIVKPANRSQGRGIFLVGSPAQLPPWMRDRAATAARSDPHIVSRYVDRPLLVSGRKFDLRIYVLVTNFAPLRAYRHEAAFARFCRTPYPERRVDGGHDWLRDLTGHLTNTSLQKQAGRPAATAQGSAFQSDGGHVAPADHAAICDAQWPAHGGKWMWENVLLYVASRFGAEARRQLVGDVDFAIVQSLRAVQPVIHNDPHCFELYGYDILLDSRLRPWLVEINASPSLEPATAADCALKTAVVSDALDLVVSTADPYLPLRQVGRHGSDDAGDTSAVSNGFTCIVDDEAG